MNILQVATAAVAVIMGAFACWLVWRSSEDE